MPITLHANGTIEGVNNTNFNNSLPSGHVIQVQSGFVNARLNTTSTSFTDITGLTATLSNVQANSKVYIVTNAHLNTADAGIAMRLFRGSTEISEPSTSGIDGAMVCNIDNFNLQVPAAHNFLDTTPGTGDITYKWQWRTSSGSQTIYLNHYLGGSTNWGSTSSITLMEVVG